MRQTKLFKLIEMKRLLLIGSLLLTECFATAQSTINYSYDDAGNRVGRVAVLSSIAHRKEHFLSDSTYTAGHELFHEIRIHPNPTQSHLRIVVQGMNLNVNYNLFLYAMSGALLINIPSAGAYTNMDLSPFPPGCYLLTIELNGQKRTWKIIKE